MNIIKTSQTNDIAPFLKKIVIAKPDSHKGQNGKILIIGGSNLFHAASLWAAEVASHFSDMVHYCSTEENNEIFLSLKKVFRNGIVIPRTELNSYAVEDDVILMGPGLVRTQETKSLVETVLKEHNDKRFVLDAGAIQMMDVKWLKNLKHSAIITPHQQEYEGMFHTSISRFSLEEKVKSVEENAKKYGCIILLKTVVDIISDGLRTVVVEGGNQGLTKGGTGDILAGLTASLFAHSDGLSASVCSSYFLKKTSDELSLTKGYWYNNSDILDTIPKVVNKLFL